MHRDPSHTDIYMLWWLKIHSNPASRGTLPQGMIYPDTVQYTLLTGKLPVSN